MAQRVRTTPSSPVSRRHRFVMSQVQRGYRSYHTSRHCIFEPVVKCTYFFYRMSSFSIIPPSVLRCACAYWLCNCAGSVCYDEGESEAESQSSSMEMSNPIFQLYEAVRGARNSQGQLFSEPFQQLPSRREYPDYYQQIKQPIALQQIR